MYRLLSASKDTYVTDKIVSGQRSTFANVGQAGTLDLFKLYNESTLSGTTAPIEVSRVLIKFDYSELTTAIVSKQSFTASLRLKDVYGGQTVPSNFTLVAFPLSKSFDEGRGFDVSSYRDLDTANFLTASTGVTWSQSGASGLGSIGADVDTMVSGNIGSGLQNLGSFQTFTRGDEDAVFNVTDLVSASVAGIIPNHGFRLSFIEAQENDTVTRFVKRFGSKQALNTTLHPKLIVEYDDRIYDTSGYPEFGVSQKLYLYNFYNGNPYNIVSGGSDVSDLTLTLHASKSVKLVTSSYQANFSASITYITSSVLYFSSSYSGSRVQTGIYSASLNLDPTSNSELNTFLSGANSFDFKGVWSSTDLNTTFSTTYYGFKKLKSGFSNAQVVNYVVNAVNLKKEYTKNDQARIRVFVQDKDRRPVAKRYSSEAQSVIIQDMRWRLKKAYSNDIIIPFGSSTKMSTDRDGMYFDMHMEDLESNEVYELEFMISNQTGKDILYQNMGFIFKVVD